MSANTTNDARRDAIFSHLRKSLGRSSSLTEDAVTRPEATGPLPADHERPAVPVDSIEGFVVKLLAAGATVDRVRDVDDVSGAIDVFVDEHHIDRAGVTSEDDLVNAINWSNEWQVKQGAAPPDAKLSVTGALAGVAETGSVVLRSDVTSPTSLNFLPDNHVVVLATNQIATHMEDVWKTLAETRDTMPRAVNFITGPSKTADVEQVLQHGAHGPRRLHIVLVG